MPSSLFILCEHCMQFSWVLFVFMRGYQLVSPVILDVYISFGLGKIEGSRWKKTISNKKLKEIVGWFNEKPGSYDWQDHGSALFLEVGKLMERKGELTVMIEWSWRVEKDQSIWFGSWSDEDRISKLVPALTGYKLLDISTFDDCWNW